MAEFLDGDGNRLTKATTEGSVDLTQGEYDQWKATQAHYVDTKPMSNWKNGLAALDINMPRFLEDHIESAHAGVATSTFQQSAYNAKKLLRGQKPG